MGPTVCITAVQKYNEHRSIVSLSPGWSESVLGEAERAGRELVRVVFLWRWTLGEEVVRRMVEMDLLAPLEVQSSFCLLERQENEF